MPDRHPCLVPYCRRTCKPGDFREWICGKHWPLVDKHLKRRRARLRRMWKRRQDPRIEALDARVWERCKAQAIERAAGI